MISRSSPNDGAAAAPGAIARGLVRAADRATLATALAGDGWPYASLVLVASTQAARPLMLLSDLAAHSRNMAADDRVSLLFDGTAGLAEPLTGPRVTLLGRVRQSAEPADRARFLSRHPAAASYAGMADFRIYRLEPTRGHLVAGFGRIHWIEAADILFGHADAQALADAETGIIAHMNDDHRDALDRYANRLLKIEGEGWTMTGIDPEGIDLRLGGATARLGFARPVRDAAEARAELVRLARVSRDPAPE